MKALIGFLKQKSIVQLVGIIALCGLVWFAGDNVDAAAWNKRSALGSIPLLPAVIEQAVSTSDALGVGRPSRGA